MDENEKGKFKRGALCNQGEGRLLDFFTVRLSMSKDWVKDKQVTLVITKVKTLKFFRTLHEG